MIKRFITLLAAFTLCGTLVYAHGDATHIMGTITAIEGDHIQLKDQAGKPVMVMLDKATKYIKAEKPSTKAELKVGTKVMIDAKMDEKMKMYSAEEIQIGAGDDKTPAVKAAAPKTATPAATKK